MRLFTILKSIRNARLKSVFFCCVFFLHSFFLSNRSSWNTIDVPFVLNINWQLFCVSDFLSSATAQYQLNILFYQWASRQQIYYKEKFPIWCRLFCQSSSNLNVFVFLALFFVSYQTRRISFNRLWYAWIYWIYIFDSCLNFTIAHHLIIIVIMTIHTISSLFFQFKK